MRWDTGTRKKSVIVRLFTLSVIWALIQCLAWKIYISKLNQSFDGPVCTLHCLNYQVSLRFITCFLVIKDWSVSAPHSHLAGGMTYKDGKLTVSVSGRYYIYAQVYYHGTGRVTIHVNNKVVSMLHPTYPGRGEGTLYTGGVFNLKAGDNITLSVGYTIKIFMWTGHSYFGAFLVWASHRSTAKNIQTSPTATAPWPLIQNKGTYSFKVAWFNNCCYAVL